VIREINFAVVIPTLNRKDSLFKLLLSLNSQSYKAKNIYVIDSSDQSQSQSDFPFSNVVYVATKIKSAAQQRNLGIKMVPDNTKVLFFLDDDTIPDHNYFELMLDTLFNQKAVGVSGLALNPEKPRREYPKGFSGLARRLALLDSKHDGKLLRSGVGIPVRDISKGLVKTDWLIGCSCWNFEKIKDLVFEENFSGYSLGEDIIFSLKASRLGNLFVNTNIILKHLELPQAESNVVTTTSLWIYNRYCLKNFVEKPNLFVFAYFWSSFCMILYKILQLPYDPILRSNEIKGYFLGFKKLVEGFIRK